MKHIVVIGANSAIAQACVERWAAREPVHLLLVARHAERVQQTAQDLRIRHQAKVDVLVADLLDTTQHPALLQTVAAQMPHIDIALIAHGTLPDQQRCQQWVEVALQEYHTNATSVISLLTLLANTFEQQQHGTIAVISSVAGDRGRASNYVYGAAKAAVTTFCSGLNARLSRVGVHVLTIKPGFVDTPMTAHLQLPKALVASPEQVGQRIVAAIDKRQDVLYAPWFWFWIMWIIVHVPTAIFKKMKF